MNNLRGLLGWLFSTWFSLGMWAQTYPVTLRIDMRGQSIAATGPSVAGNFQSLIGGNNWNPGQLYLQDADQDSIYEISFQLPAGLYAYKFINGSSWGDPTEFLGPDCGRADGAGNFNRELAVGPYGADLPPHSFDQCEGLIRFQVDMSQQNVGIHGVHVSGDWLGMAGYGFGWQPDALPMFDTDNDEVYEVTAFVQDTNMVRYKFYNGNSSADEEMVPGPCSSPTALVTRYTQGSLAPQTLAVVCFSECGPCQFQADTNYATYWWNESVFYEIFVRSFFDADGDGIGDFQGIIQKLDYLNDGDPSTTTDLGIDGIWLMPVMPSPSYHGYDVTNYEAINPDYGSMADFEAFLDSAHARGIKVILDFVMNHTSTQHPWFTSSANNPNGPHANHYIWSPVDSAYSGPWGQPVWHSWGSRYFYGLFWSGMPDLNYNEPAVKLAMLDAAEFWLNKGVDGFRLDAIKYLDEDFPVLENTPETFQLLQEYKQRIRSVNAQALSVGEVWSTTAEVVPYVDTTLLDLCFEFDLAGTLLQTVNTANTSIFENNFIPIVNAYPQLQLAPFLTNHDQDRVMSFLGEDVSKMKLAAGLLMTMPGTPFIYYGEEIGMTGTGAHENIRRPMQWSSANWAGFTTGTPWIGVNGNFGQYNVATMNNNGSSLLNTYRQLIQLRRSNEILQKGYPLLLDVDEPQAISFARILGNQGLLIVANLSGNAAVQPTLHLTASTLLPDDYVAVDLLSGDTVGALQVLAQGDIVSAQMSRTLAPRNIWVLQLLPTNAFGISEPQPSNQCRLFPNPADDIFSVDWPGQILQSVTIYDFSGRQLDQPFIEIGQKKVKCDFIPRGIYLVVLRSISGQTAVQRLVKQ